MTMLEAALEYAAKGWPVFPCKPEAKSPATHHGCKDAVTDPDQIRAWWTHNPSYNIGIATGEMAGIYVLDVDVADGKPGMESLAALEAEIGPIPRDCVVQTATGGRHIYMQPPAGTEIKNSAGKLGDGLDVRGDGGYVIAPPSIHPNGFQYAWLAEGNPQPAPNLAGYIAQRGKGKGKGAADEAPGTFMQEGRRNSDMARLLGAIRRASGLGEEGLALAGLPVNAGVENPLPESEVRAVARSIAGYDDNPIPHDDLELSRYLADRLKDDFRACGKEAWWRWDGQRWMDGTGAEATLQEAVKDHLGVLKEIAYTNGGKFKGCTAHKVKAMRGLLWSETALRASLSDFDAQSRYLNLRNGTLDLTSAAVVPHDRTLMLTKLAPVAWDEDATCPIFDAFLAQVQPDPEVRAFLARLFGYALLGDPIEQKFFIFSGRGRNGKSTLLETVKDLLGDYAATVDPSAFLRKKEDGPSQGLAHLPGKRLAITSELAKGQILDAPTVKRFTGGEEVVAKKLYRDPFPFRPVFVPIMGTNEPPVFDGADSAMARRIVHVPFNVVVPVEDQDDQLAHKLAGERAGILRWMVDGLRDYRRNGLAIPEVIRAASAKLVRESDLIQTFLDETCEVAANVRDKTEAVFRLYQAWCMGQGVKALNAKFFAQELEKKGICKVRSNGMFYDGVRLQGTKGRLAVAA